MAKAGRKRNSGKRQPNGQLSRPGENQQAADMVSVGVKARVGSDFGAPEKQARDPDWGHSLGVLRLKHISRQAPDGCGQRLHE